jgi:hypothetical protein
MKSMACFCVEVEVMTVSVPDAKTEVLNKNETKINKTILVLNFNPVGVGDE